MNDKKMAWLGGLAAVALGAWFLFEKKPGSGTSNAPPLLTATTGPATEGRGLKTHF